MCSENKLYIIRHANFYSVVIAEDDYTAKEIVAEKYDNLNVTNKKYDFICERVYDIEHETVITFEC